jgi:hypothetical protein
MLNEFPEDKKRILIHQKYESIKKADCFQPALSSLWYFFYCVKSTKEKLIPIKPPH